MPEIVKIDGREIEIPESAIECDGVHDSLIDVFECEACSATLEQLSEGQRYA